MQEEGSGLIELIIILPIILSLTWLSLDALMVYRDEYLLHYSLFHSLRTASVGQPDSFTTNLQLSGLVAVGEKGTGRYLPLMSGLTNNKGRLASSISLIREAKFQLLPPASSELSVLKELAY